MMDFMKKGITQESVDRICSDCVDLGIGVHCYVIVGFPTETEEEALETMNFVVENTKTRPGVYQELVPTLALIESLMRTIMIRMTSRIVYSTSTVLGKVGDSWNFKITI